jgi:signal transduction histidine kinase
MQEVIKVAGGAVNATSAYICDYDTEANAMTVMVEYFSPDATQKEAESDLGITYAIEEHFPTTGKWLQNPDSVHYIQVSDPDLDDIERAEYQQYDAKTVLHIPIFIDGALYGYLEIWESRYERQFTRAEIEMLQAIASQISSSFRNAQLFAALKQSEVALRQQTDDLEARNRELDAYSHTIAHDLKNPLHMVLNYAAFVLEEDGDKLSDESREYMDRVLQFSMNMTVMIDQLLMLAKYRDASEISEPVDMPPVVDHVLEMCSTLIEENHRHGDAAPARCDGASYMGVRNSAKSGQ